MRTADFVVAGYRVHKDGAGVGSLLLGLYDSDAVLHHVGVASSFDAKTRARFAEELALLCADALADHPWADWGEPTAHGEGGAVSTCPAPRAVGTRRRT